MWFFLIWPLFRGWAVTAPSRNQKNIQINTKFDLDKSNECMRVRNITSAMFVTRTLFNIPVWTPISKLRMKIRNQVHHLFSEELHYNVIHAKTYFIQHHVNLILRNNLIITFILFTIIIRYPRNFPVTRLLDAPPKASKHAPYFPHSSQLLM